LAQFHRHTPQVNEGRPVGQNKFREYPTNITTCASISPVQTAFMTRHLLYVNIDE
jgi:hypothetical protein